MAVEVKLQQRLQQSLVLTPQLQQSLKMLQMGHLEYAESLAQELLENPALEESGSAGEDFADERSPSDNAEAPSFEMGFNSGGDFSYEFIAQMPEGIATHLFLQLRTCDLSQEEMEIAIQIIGNLNKDGYLEVSLQEIADELKTSELAVLEVLQQVQLLDPPGIAARDLKECLLIQLEQQGWKNELPWRLVECHLGLMEIRKHEQIAKLEGVSVAALLEALTIIRNLEPRPGRPFLDELPVFITPDVYVKKVGEEFHISLNESGLPRIRLNNEFQQLLADRKSGDRQYLQEKSRSASWLLKNIQLRQDTIVKVARSIVEHQREFFEQGVQGLKPLVLREVAESVGLHESTVSRVTSNKYMHTPQGIFEMKYFFRSGIRANEGDMSSEAVKEKIRALFDHETPNKPLSDQEVVEQLKTQGITIARRTVAKYREAMNILPSSQRKRLY